MRRRSIDDWKSEGLESELAFHKRNKWRVSPEFLEDSYELFKKIGINDFKIFQGLNVLDAGCGSKLRTAIFEGCQLYGSDPLADQYMSEIEWSDLNKCVDVFSVASEQFIPSISEKMDVVITINAIDHGYDYKKSIDNFYDYLKKDGSLHLFVDIERIKEDKIHSKIDRNDILGKLEEKFHMRNFSIFESGFDRGCKMFYASCAKKS